MTIYYVDPVSGNDGTLDGTAPTDEGGGVGPWATFQHALDNAIAGDNVRLMTTGTESITAVIDADTQNGTASSSIIYEAADSSGDAHTDGTRYHIQATASIANVLNFGGASGGQYCEFRFIDFDGNSNTTSHGIDATVSDDGLGSSMIGCRVRNNGGDGANVRGSSAFGLNFLACEIDGNTGSGLAAQSTASSRFSYSLIQANDIHDNGGDGIYTAGIGTTILANRIYGNTGSGIEIPGATDRLRILQNTIYGNGADAITWVTGAVIQLHGNSLANSGGYGINGVGLPQTASNNHTNGNTTAATNFASMPGFANQTGDPLFADPGNSDFTPSSLSPLVGASLAGENIGAVSPATGGGLLTHPGMSGGMRG